jgi:hypothetical protein
MFVYEKERERDRGGFTENRLYFNVCLFTLIYFALCSLSDPCFFRPARPTLCFVRKKLKKPKNLELKLKKIKKNLKNVARSQDTVSAPSYGWHARTNVAADTCHTSWSQNLSLPRRLHLKTNPLLRRVRATSQATNKRVFVRNSDAGLLSTLSVTRRTNFIKTFFSFWVKNWKMRLVCGLHIRTYTWLFSGGTGYTGEQRASQ